MGGGASNHRKGREPTEDTEEMGKAPSKNVQECSLAIPDVCHNLLTDNREVIFERKEPFDYCKNTFFTSKPVRLKNNERKKLDITVNGGAVFRIGLIDEKPRQDDFVKSAVFETEDGCECGTSRRCLYLNSISCLQYGSPDEPREFLELNPNTPMWLYITVIYGTPKISATYENEPIQWTTFDDTDIGLIDPPTEAVCGLVTASEKCIVRETLKPEDTYLIRWDMKLERALVADKRPEYGFIRIGITNKEPTNLAALNMNLTVSDSMDDSIVWCSDSAIRNYPYSGTVALSVNATQGSISHNVLVSSVGSVATRKEVLDLGDRNLRLVVELSSGTLRVEHCANIAVEQPLGSIIHVKNYQEFPTKEALQYSIARTGHMPCKIFYGADPTSFVVEFRDKFASADINDMKKKIHKDLKVLADTRCIQVIGVPDDFTEYDLTNFFSNPKFCDGGEIQSVNQSKSVSDAWIIQFASAKVARQVYRTEEYSIEGNVVTVLPYYEELGCALNKRNRPVYDREPLVVCLDILDEDKVSFVRERLEEVGKLKKYLKQNASVSLVWKETEQSEFDLDEDDDEEEEVVQLECCLAPGDFEKLSNWKDNAKSFLEKYFKDEIIEAVVQIEPKAWDNALGLLNTLQNTRDFVYHNDEEKHNIKLIASKHTDLRKISDEIGKVLPPVEKETVTLYGEKAKKYLLLDANKKVSDLGKRYTGTRFSTDKQKPEVTFTGPIEEVNNIYSEVHILFLKVRMISATINNAQARVCQKVQPDLSMAMRKKGLSGDFNLSDRFISVYMYCDTEDSDGPHRENLLMWVKELIKNTDIPLRQGDDKVCSKPTWKTFCDNIEKKYAACMTLSRHNNAIQVYAVSDHLEIVCDDIRQFLNSQSANTEVLIVTHDIAHYLDERAFPETHRDGKFIIDMNGEEYTGKIILNGDTNTKESTRRSIVDEKKGVKTFWCFISQKWLAGVIEKIAIKRLSFQHESVILPEIGDSLAETGISTVSILKRYGVAVLVRQASITQMNVDVVVSAADPGMKMESRIAKAIIARGGPDIKKECLEYLTQQKIITEGDAFSTTAGILPFCRVIHAVAPRWKGGGTGEEALMKNTIRKVLQIADAEGFSSVAIPILSYGDEKYPVEQLCKHTLETVKEYIEKGSCKTLATIYMCDYSQPVVNKLVESQQNIFNKGDWIFFKHNKTLTIESEDPGPVVDAKVSRPVSARGTRNRWGADDWSRTQRHPRMPTVAEQVGEYDGNSDQQQNATFSGGLPYNIDLSHTLRLNVVKGAIENLKVDVIVCPTFHFPGLSGVIAKTITNAAGGQQFIQDCDQLGSLDLGQVKRTSGGNLNCQHVYLTKIETSWSNESWQRVYDVVRKSLDGASKHKQKTIAFPIFGTGLSKYPVDKFAAAMIKSVLKFARRSRDTTLTDVYIVVYYQDNATAGIIETCVPQMFTGQSGSGDTSNSQNDSFGRLPMQRGTLSACIDAGRNRNPEQRVQKLLKYKRPKERTDHSEADDFVAFKIISKQPYKEVQTAIETLVNDEFITEENALVIPLEFEEKEDKLSPNENKLLESTAEIHNISIVIGMQDKKPILKLSGLRSSVKKSKPTFNDIVIRKFPDIRLRKKMANGVRQQFQWSYEDGGEKKEVSAECNLDLYMGYIRGQDFTYKNDKTMYKVRCKSLEEHPVGNPKMTRRLYLKAKVNADIRVPDSWNIFTSGQEFEEVPLDPNDKTFNDVKAKFISGKCQFSKIERIIRIENKYLWLQYYAKKLQLEAQNKQAVQNERELWHGTDIDTAKLIVKRGYDRGFVGKHAAFFGCGTYFAVESEYSGRSTYAKPDDKGVRRMILNKVLTGYFTKVNEDDTVLPLRIKTNTECIPYDSAVDNPNNIAMFIIFHDCQAYPQYLIEYKA